MGAMCSEPTATDFFSDSKYDGEEDSMDKENRRAVNEWVPQENFVHVVIKKNTRTRELLMDRLTSHHLLQALGKTELMELVDAMEAFNVSVGRELISLGDTMTRMYVVETGELMGIREGGPEKGKEKKIKVFKPGDFIGDKALLSEATASATVTCSGNQNAVVWAIEGGTYRNTLAAMGERLAAQERIRRGIMDVPQLRRDVMEDDIEQLIAKLERPVVFEPGERIITQKGRADKLYIICNGKVTCGMGLRADGGAAATKGSGGTTGKFRLRTGASSASFSEGSAAAELENYGLMKRRFEATTGQVLGIHALQCQLSLHAQVAVAKTRVEIVPIPMDKRNLFFKDRYFVDPLMVQVVASLPAFANIPLAFIKAMMDVLPAVTYKAGDLVLRQGDAEAGNVMILVRSGTLITARSDRTRINVIGRANSFTQRGGDLDSKPGVSSGGGGGGSPRASASSSASRRKGRNSGDSIRGSGSGGGTRRSGSSSGNLEASSATSAAAGKSAAEIAEVMKKDLPALVVDPVRSGPYDWSHDDLRTRLQVCDTFGMEGLMEETPSAPRVSVVAESDEVSIVIIPRGMYQRVANEARVLKKAKRAAKKARAAAEEEAHGRSRASFFRSSFAGKSKGKSDAEAAAAEDEANVDDVDDDEGAGQAGGVALTSDWKYASDPSIQLRQLRQVKVLGRGAFGYVRQVRDKATDREYALKALAKPQLKASHAGRGFEKLVRERDAQVLCGSHPLVTRLVNTYEDSKAVYILMELNPGKELFELLYRKDKTGASGPVSLNYARFTVANIVLALGHCHAQGFTYRDLKPENVIITKNGYAKLIDFGFAKHLAPGEKAWTLCGTAEYLAPEIVLGTGHDHAVDWWSLGILAYELRAGKTPFDYQPDTDDDMYGDEENQARDKERRRRNAIMNNIVSQKLKMPRNRFDEAGEKTVKRLLKREPSERLGSFEAGGTESIRRAPWFRGLDWEKVLDKRMSAPPLR